MPCQASVLRTYPSYDMLVDEKVACYGLCKVPCRHRTKAQSKFTVELRGVAASTFPSTSPSQQQTYIHVRVHSHGKSKSVPLSTGLQSPVSSPCYAMLCYAEYRTVLCSADCTGTNTHLESVVQHSDDLVVVIRDGHLQVQPVELGQVPSSSIAKYSTSQSKQA